MNVLELGKALKRQRAPRWKKALLVGAVLYAVLPFDFVPDVLPVIGWLDDVGLLGAALATLLRSDARLGKSLGAERTA